MKIKNYGSSSEEIISKIPIPMSNDWDFCNKSFYKKKSVGMSTGIVFMN